MRRTLTAALLAVIIGTAGCSTQSDEHVPPAPATRVVEAAEWAAAQRIQAAQQQIITACIGVIVNHIAAMLRTF